MRAAVVVFGAGLAACAPLSPSGSAPTSALPTARVASAPPAPPAPAPVEPPRARCLTAAPPAPPAPEERRAEGLCHDHRAVERRLAPLLLRRFTRTMEDSTVEVRFGCDPLRSDVERVVLEFGSGHAGGLSLWRLSKRPEEQAFDVVGFELRQAHDRGPRGDTLLLARAQLDASRLEAALATARPALTARFRELEPPPLPRGVRGSTSSMSTASFHAFVELRDGWGDVLDGAYSGYPSSAEQARFLGLRAALGVLWPLVEPLATTPSVPTNEERAFFVRHYLASSARLQEPSAWWVRERATRLAGHLGTLALVPSLVEQLRRTLTEFDASTDENPTAERLLEATLDALTRLTGWDARSDAQGQALRLPDAARTYLESCSSPPSAAER